MALADYGGFNSNGFRIVALIDTDPGKSGRVSRQGIPVHPWEKLSSLVLRNRIDIGIIAVPAEAAQAVYDALADAGIQAVLNFAPVQLKLRSAVKVKSVDLRINLESLSFHLKKVEG
jgi:redox-sensing transcriptional repressor